MGCQQKKAVGIDAEGVGQDQSPSDHQTMSTKKVVRAQGPTLVEEGCLDASRLLMDGGSETGDLGQVLLIPRTSFLAYFLTAFLSSNRCHW